MYVCERGRAERPCASLSLSGRFAAGETHCHPASLQPQQGAGGSLLKPRVLGPVPPATVPAEPAVALVLGTSSLSRAGYDEGWKALSVPLTCAHLESAVHTAHLCTRLSCVWVTEAPCVCHIYFALYFCLHTGSLDRKDSAGAGEEGRQSSSDVSPACSSPVGLLPESLC